MGPYAIQCGTSNTNGTPAKKSADPRGFIGMRMKSQTQRTLLFSFLGSIVACGLLGVYCLLQGNIGPVEGRILLSTGLVGIASILGLIGVMAWEQRRWHPLGMLGVIAAATALLLSLILVWSNQLGLRQLDQIERYWKVMWKVMGIAWVLAAALPHASLLAFARLHASLLWVRRMTIIALGFLAALISFAILSEGEGGDMLFRLIGVFAIADVCGTIAMPILHRISSIHRREAVRTAELYLTMTCPRCELTQKLSTGRTACKQCGLRFLIEIEENLCEKCGYPLYKLESAACPECGTPILQSAASASV